MQEAMKIQIEEAKSTSPFSDIMYEDMMEYRIGKLKK